MSQTENFRSKDILVKVAAAVFLNPADRDRQGAKIFIQDFLGCGCPDEVVEQAKISFFFSPLGVYLYERIADQGPSPALTALEEEVNTLTEIPGQLMWPREPSGHLVPPTSWGASTLQAVAGKPEEQETLARLRDMSKVTIDVVIEVPGRALFFLAIVDTKGPSRKGLALQYDAGQLLYKLMDYNRCRLFTLSHADGPKIIPQIDTALTWQGLCDAFARRKDQYPFARPILDLFDHALI